MAEALRPAVFLDRDGVLVEDEGPVAGISLLRLTPGAADATLRLAQHGYVLVGVTNQPVVARGLATEAEIAAIHRSLTRRLEQEGGATIAAFYVCPHHPNADVPAYRVECECRKPRAGLLLEAAEELGLDLARSFMVGDRMSDIAAGARAGCRTVLVRTGAHLDPPIESPDPPDPGLSPGHVCDDLVSAADWITGQR